MSEPLRAGVPPASAQAVGTPAARRPVRLQRSRRKGSTRPDGAIYVGRPTLWGNPFRSDRFGHARSVKLHRSWLAGQLGVRALARLGFEEAEILALARRRDRVIARLGDLADRDLECWCALTHHWCHAETLLALGNRRRAE